MARNTASSGSVSEAQRRFALAPVVDIQRSTFDRSYNYKSTFDEGMLIPFFVDEMLPGDSISLKANIVCRMATPKYPIMNQLWITTHYFFVPNRIIWPNWKKLQGEQKDPDEDITTYVVPTVDSPVGGWTEGSLGDYMGLPTGVDITTSALPFRAYNAVFNAWLRDEDLVDSATVNLLDTNDNAAWYSVLYRAKRHDYFTAARPWPLKGGTEVSIPLGTTAAIYQTAFTSQDTSLSVDAGGEAYAGTFAAQAADRQLLVDLADAAAATLNDLREAIALQQALELDARGGTRYVEAIKARFHVTSPDFRLQRPEYIGGGRQPMNVTAVPQTSRVDPQTDVTYLGDLAGFGHSAGDGHGASYSATEHGILLGLVSITGDQEYWEGIPRMWKRSTRWDFFEPVFANLGEQEILNGEIFADGTATDDAVWGYQERWAEYRYKPSQITGAFRSNAATPLDSWHTAEEFGALPPLNDQFIQTSSDCPNVGRCVATPAEPHFLFDSFTQLRHTRPMPVYSVPGLRRL